jgi:hypothetical protein
MQNLTDSPRRRPASLRESLFFVALIALGLSVGEFPTKVFWPFGGPSIAACMILILMLRGVRNLHQPIFLAVIGLMVCTLLSYTANFDMIWFSRPDRVPIDRLIILTSFTAFCFARLDARSLRWTAASLVLGCAWASSVGWFRFVTGLGGLPTEHALNYWGIRYDIATRNGDALYLLIALSFLAAVPWRSVRLLIMALTLPAAVLSYSRSAWVAIVLLFSERRGFWRRIIAAVLVLAVLLGYGYSESLYDRALSIFAPGQNASNAERLHLFAASLSRISMLGVGAGNFGGLNLTAIYFGHAENFALTLVVESGILALLAFATLWAWVLWNAPIRRAAVALSAYLMLNSEIDNVVLWLVVGLFFHAAANAVEAKAASRQKRAELGSEEEIAASGALPAPAR